MPGAMAMVSPSWATFRASWMVVASPLTLEVLAAEGQAAAARSRKIEDARMIASLCVQRGRRLASRRGRPRVGQRGIAPGRQLSGSGLLQLDGGAGSGRQK